MTDTATTTEAAPAVQPAPTPAPQEGQTGQGQAPEAQPQRPSARDFDAAMSGRGESGGLSDAERSFWGARGHADAPAPETVQGEGAAQEGDTAPDSGTEAGAATEGAQPAETAQASPEMARLQAEARRAQELEEQLGQARLQALDAEVAREAPARFQQTDAYREHLATYQRMREAEQDGVLEEGTASRYWRNAAQPAYEQFTNQLRSQGREAFENAQAGERFAAQARQRAMQLPGPLTSVPGFSEVVDAALEDFDALVARPGRFPALDQATTQQEAHEAAQAEFKKFLGQRLLMDPRSAPTVRRFLSEAKAKQAAAGAAPVDPAVADADRRRQQGAERDRNVASNPLGNVTPNQTRPTALERSREMSARHFDRLMSRR